MRVATQRGLTPRRFALSAAVLAILMLVALAGRAQAAELTYWNNYKAIPQTISVANLDGSGGGLLNLTGATLVDPEGMAIDTVGGRLYVASSSGGPAKTGEILFANLDGTGAGVFTAPGAPVFEPFGVVVDPATRMIYWANAANGPSDKGSIAWARLDGSVGGILNTAGATLDDPYKLTLDPVNGRVYWGSYPEGKLRLSYANVNGSGGADLNLNGFELESAYAFAADPANGRLYWSGGKSGTVFTYTGLLGGPVATLNTAPAVHTSSYGFAVDPSSSKIYWPNYNNNANPLNGLGFANLSGGGGGNISPLTAPFDGPQDLLVLKSPSGTAAPGISRAQGNRSVLTCSTGSWAADFAGSFVYQAPTTYAYQWLRNGQAIGGATAATLSARSAGKYTCTVTAANQAGSAAQTSALVKVEASKAKLTTKRKVTVKAGGSATFRLTVTNQGDLISKRSRVCVTLPKTAKGELQAAKRCKALGKLKGRGRKSAKLKLRALPAAGGVYAVSFKVKGTAGRAAKAKVVVR